jgi:O-acetyl-ADP-ribose deacetylase (regulator of RNase III)
MFKILTDRLRSSKRQFTDRVRLYHGEILKTKDVDAICFFMTPALGWGGPLNQAVLQMAGAKLDEYVLENVTSPQAGEAYLLPVFNAPYKKLVMMVLNEWDGGIDFEDSDLVKVYRRAIQQAQDSGLTSIAFPAMGRDKRDFPHIRFARLALEGIAAGLDGRLEEVKIICRDQRMVDTYTERLNKIR